MCEDAFLLHDFSTILEVLETAPPSPGPAPPKSVLRPASPEVLPTADCSADCSATGGAVEEGPQLPGTPRAAHFAKLSADDEGDCTNQWGMEGNGR